jgi:anaphase-promoting complex subunit 2
MYTYYGQIRIKRLFDIIIDFPDSKNAIDDLKICLTKTNLRSNLINSLKSSIEQRLLHPGVNTSDILTAYVSAIKALLCLDTSGVMMENVCEPLKKYLRNRDDTVKCIISNLTDDGESSNDLMEEFCKDLYNNDGCLDLIDSNVAMPIQTCQNDMNNVKNNQNKARSWELWIPDAVDAIDSSALDNNRQGSKSNIISMLVNIYGSKDMFVNEYKTLLADRLLSNYSYNMEKEIRNLELLKLRFGDSNLFSCEAMLKDISESKRINTNILEQLKQKGIEKIESFEVGPSSLKCLILSEQFWPKLKEEKIELPNEFKLIQEKFMNSYEAFKGNRTLIWKNNLGQVNIEIEINKQIMEFNVTPIQAAVILKFQEKDRWSIHELSQSLKMCSIALRKKLVYWKMQGLIKEASLAKSNNANEIIDNASNEIYVLVKENGKVYF